MWKVLCINERVVADERTRRLEGLGDICTEIASEKEMEEKSETTDSERARK